MWSFSSCRHIKSEAVQLVPEDDDVIRERNRVLSGAAKDDVIRVENLTKVSTGFARRSRSSCSFLSIFLLVFSALLLLWQMGKILGVDCIGHLPQPLKLLREIYTSSPLPLDLSTCSSIGIHHHLSPPPSTSHSANSNPILLLTRALIPLLREGTQLVLHVHVFLLIESIYTWTKPN